VFERKKKKHNRMHWFFHRRNLVKFRAEKYDFDLYKGFFLEQFAKIAQISEEKDSKLPDFQ